MVNGKVIATDEMVGISNPKFLRIIDWIPDDWDDADECARDIMDASGDYECHELTDEIICNIARMVGICN